MPSAPFNANSMQPFGTWQLTNTVLKVCGQSMTTPLALSALVFSPQLCMSLLLKINPSFFLWGSPCSPYASVPKQCWIFLPLWLVLHDFKEKASFYQSNNSTHH